VAIMPAMMVGVGAELYAIPLSNIVEIVRPEPNQLGSVDGKRVLRIRDTVLPMVSLADLFDTPAEKREESRFAVVIELNEQRAALIVSQLIGQQEVVIKPLDSGYSGSAPVSGATVRDDGGVSLIIDVARVMSAAKESKTALAVA
jgi:two-component system, chemotaxis family, sensor kinase CheA